MKREEQKVRMYNLLKYQRQKDTKSVGINRPEVPFSWPTMSDNDTSTNYKQPH